MSPSGTVDGPDRLTVIGSDSAIVVVTDPAPDFTDTRDDTSDVIVPNATVNVSAVSDRSSSTTATSKLWVAPAAEPAANVRVDGVAV